MQDFFMLDIPVFIPVYDRKKKYGWSRHYDELWDLLKETTGGYCMYCYDSVWINGQRRGQIEHGIERMNSIDHLTDCVPNLGLACSNCNEKYKRRGETQRKLSLNSIKKFEEGTCKKFDCKRPCRKYEKLRTEYARQGKIMLHPFETKILEGGHSLRLQYDLLECKYIPSTNCGIYSKEELEVLHGHIELFGLNRPERKNFEIGRYCKNVIDFHSLMQDVEYNNLLVELLRKKLMILNIKDAIKVCKIVYSNAWMQLST